jgi:hypothetical protein
MHDWKIGFILGLKKAVYVRSSRGIFKIQNPLPKSKNHKNHPRHFYHQSKYYVANIISYFYCYTFIQKSQTINRYGTVGTNRTTIIAS